MALVLTRKINEKIYIGDSIVVKVLDVKKGDQVVISIEAPKDIRILRDNAKIKEPTPESV
jgi:carbon storage regulator